MLSFSLFSKLLEDARNLLKITCTKMTSVINLFKLMSCLKAHIFVSFHCFVQVFLARKYSAVSSLALDRITLLYIVNKLPLCSQWLFVTICSQWSFQKKTKSSFKMIMKKKGGLRIKFQKTIC